MAGPAPDLLAGLEALDRLDDLTHRARQVPLTDQVRVDPEAFRAELATIRAATAPVLEHEAGAAAQPLTRSVDALQRIVDEAPALPVGRKVRVDQAAVYEALDAFRAALPDAIRRQRGITTGEPAIPAPWAAELRPGIEAVDRLDDLVHHARTVPLTGQVRPDPADHRAAIDAIRHGTAPLLQDEARVSRRPLTEAIDALQRMLDDAPTLPLGSDVRVSREAVLDALDELRARLSEVARRRGGGPDAVCRHPGVAGRGPPDEGPTPDPRHRRRHRTAPAAALASDDARHPARPQRRAAVRTERPRPRPLLPSAARRSRLRRGPA